MTTDISTQTAAQMYESLSAHDKAIVEAMIRMVTSMITSVAIASTLKSEKRNKESTNGQDNNIR